MEMFRVVQVGDRWVAECTKGLWSVDAPTYQEALSNGMHYYMQYAQDGEYEKDKTEASKRQAEEEA